MRKGHGLDNWKSMPILATLPVAGLVALLLALAPTPAHAANIWYSAICPGGSLVNEGDSFVMSVRNRSLHGAAESGAAPLFDVKTTPWRLPTNTAASVASMASG